MIEIPLLFVFMLAKYLAFFFVSVIGGAASGLVLAAIFSTGSEGQIVWFLAFGLFLGAIGYATFTNFIVWV